MKISAYEKFWLTTGLCTLIGFVFGLISVETQSKLSLLLFFAWAFIASYLIHQIKCPNCGAPLTFQGKLLGLPIWGGFAHRKCKSCEVSLCSK